MLRGLRTVGFRVADLEAAKSWYSELIGHGPYFNQPFYVGFDVGGYELGLQPAAEGHQPGVGGDTVDWAVDDIDAVMVWLIEHGASEKEAIADVGDNIRVGSVVDPFGNVLGLISNPNFAPPMVAASGAELSDRAIVVETVVPVDPRAAWDLWTSSEGLAAWWAQNTRIELRVGGFFEIYFTDEVALGQRGSEGCRFLSFVPGRMLSFTWNAPPHLKTRNHPTWCVIDFDAVEDGTRVVLTHLGWPEPGWSEAGSDWPETFEYFEKAWRFVLDLFAEHLSS